jgi:hypothetical protein
MTGAKNPAFCSPFVSNLFALAVFHEASRAERPSQQTTKGDGLSYQTTSQKSPGSKVIGI